MQALSYLVQHIGCYHARSAYGRNGLYHVFVHKACSLGCVVFIYEENRRTLCVSQNTSRKSVREIVSRCNQYGIRIFEEFLRYSPSRLKSVVSVTFIGASLSSFKADLKTSCSGKVSFGAISGI